MSNRVYSAQFNISVPANGNGGSSFSIQSVGREISIKSVFLAWYIAVNATGLPKPWRSVADQSIYLQIGSINNKLAAPFRYVSGSLPSANGNYLVMTEPGQLVFNSFFVPNDVAVFFTINNFTAAIVDHFVNITIETEEKTMFL